MVAGTMISALSRINASIPPALWATGDLDVVSVNLPLLSANASQPVPLSHTDWLMYMRPHGWGMEFCERPIHRQSVYLPKATDTQPKKCRFGSSDDDGIFRYVLSFQKVELSTLVTPLLKTFT